MINNQNNNNLTEQQIGALNHLYLQCSTYLSESECLSFLSSSNWNYQHCEYLLVSIPKEIENKTNVPPVISLRILNDSQVDWRNLDLCQHRVNMLVELCQKTRLNYYMCFDCLTQSDWNCDLALELFNRHKTNIPESGFINNNQPPSFGQDFVNETNAFQQESMMNNQNDSVPTLNITGESPSSFGNVYFSIGNQLPSSFTDQSNIDDVPSSSNNNVQPHANTPENSPNESASILTTSRISIISNYF